MFDPKSGDALTKIFAISTATFRHGAMTPFRNEKNPNWEGAYLVPAIFRWPGKIKPGEVCNEISRSAADGFGLVPLTREPYTPTSVIGHFRDMPLHLGNGCLLG